MIKVFVADVGDGLSISLFLNNHKKIQIECGTADEWHKAYQKFKMTTLFPKKEETFILSHFHVNHYSGLLYAANIKDQSFLI